MEQRGGLERKREEGGGNNKEEDKTVLAKIQKVIRGIPAYHSGSVLKLTNLYDKQNVEFELTIESFIAQEFQKSLSAMFPQCLWKPFQLKTM